MKDNHFFAMMSRMKYIDRWQLMRNTLEENLCEHSHNVAMIAHCLGVINNIYFGGDINADRLAVLGIYHDSTEIITGDMPTPIKYYNPLIREAYKEVETIAKDELLMGLPKEMQPIYNKVLQDTEEEARLWEYVKAADKLSAYIKCLEEKSMGNSDFDRATEATLAKVKEMKMPEVDFFLEKFIPPYMLTLDESR